MIQYTYKEAIEIATRMGSSEPLVLIRVMQVFGLLTLKAEPEKLPIFEIIEPDGNHIKIYKNGQISGISGIIINRIDRS